MEKINYKLINVLLILLIIFLIFILSPYWVAYFSKGLSIILPIFLAFIIAYGLYPIKKELNKKIKNETITVSLIYLVILVLLVLLFVTVIPLLYEQLKELPKAFDQAINYINNRYKINLNPYVSTYLFKFSKAIKEIDISNGVISIINSSLSLIVTTFLTFILSIYFLLDMKNIKYKVSKFIEKRQAKYLVLAEKIDKELTDYFKGLFICMLIIFTEYLVVYKIIGHPNFVVIAFLTAILNVVPMFGGIIANLFALLLALFNSPSLFFKTLIVVVVFPNLDSYFTLPKVYNQTNKVKPLWVICSIVICGALMGSLGVLLAVPIYLIIREIIEYDIIKNK